METPVLLKRFGFYLIGFSVGLVFLAFFIKQSGSKIEFCYGIDCRILKNIRSKNLVYTSKAEAFISSKSIDTASINYILREGDVNMSKSNTKLDSCKVYVVEGKIDKQNLFLTIENCSKKATIQSIDFQ